MVQATKALFTANDTASAEFAELAAGALTRMTELNYDVFVGNNGMPPISYSNAQVVGWGLFAPADSLGDELGCQCVCVCGLGAGDSGTRGPVYCSKAPTYRGRACATGHLACCVGRRESC
jgi:hypothetical protein